MFRNVTFAADPVTAPERGVCGTACEKQRSLYKVEDAWN